MKLTKRTVSYGVLLICMLALLLLALAPTVYCGRFATLAADDYSNGARVHQAVTAGRPFYSVLAAAAKQAAETYVNWQGTFSAVFLMALSPAALFGEGFYALTPAIMLASLALGIFLLSSRVYAGLFGIDKSCAAVVAAVTLLLCTQLLPSVRESFFWYCGAVYYTFIFGLSLCAYACAIAYVRGGGRWRPALLCLLALLIGGGNYVTALCSAVIACCAMAYLIFKKNRRWRGLAVPAVLLLLSFLLSVIAPGNQLRQASTWRESSGVVSAVLLSLRTGAVMSVQWMSLPLAGALLFLLPLFCSALRRPVKGGGERLSFKYPLLVTAGSYLLLSSMFCPHLYSIGSIGPGRLQNIIFFAYVLLLCFDLFYWTGWALSRRERAEAAGKDGAPLVATGLCAAAVCLCLGLHVVLGGSLGSLLTLNLARSEEAAEYYAQTQQRYALLHDETVADPVLEPYHVAPYMIFDDDISVDPEYWVNKDMSTYYGKNSIRLAVTD